MTTFSEIERATLLARIEERDAEIARQNSEIATLKEHIALHGDTLSLGNDVRIITEQRDEAEAEVRHLQSRLGTLKTAFRVNMLTIVPNCTHEMIDLVLDKIENP